MPKWVSPGRRGVPDRILFMPGTPAVFVEFKAPDGEVEPWQKRWHDWLESVRFIVWVVDDLNEFRRLVRLHCAEHQ